MGKRHAMVVQSIREEGGDVPDMPEFKSSPVEKSKFHCDICDINLTSQMQYDQHIGGSKHMLIAGGAKPSDFQNYKGT